MNKEFWKNKKVLITGQTGFKGSWLSLWLQSAGTTVVGYSSPPPTKPSLYEVANVEDGLCSVNGDVRDLEHLKATIDKHQPEIIIHMAAQSLVRHSYSDPVETYTTNVVGTVNVLEAVRQINGPRIVLIITSDKCYQNNEWLWGYRENDPMGGDDPYSSSKGCAELITSAYRNSFFPINKYPDHRVAVASVRAGNVIGGGDWSHDRLIPDIVKAIINRHPIKIRNPHSVRPWQYVLEPLSGYLRLIEYLSENGPKYIGGWNFGPNEDDTKPVSWIVEKITKLWGGSIHWELDNNGKHPHEAGYLKLDCSKAKTLLNWMPRLNLEEALERTVKWYYNHHLGKDMSNYTELELTSYEDCQDNQVN
ncbi:MAG: CDP-glucose 4,6-dehydratase [Candidatus Scalindua sp.]|nr:MAG: CDP-glucose 4,6-dehydratase [Candidatus Scalindua sp.]